MGAPEHPFQVLLQAFETSNPDDSGALLEGNTARLAGRSHSSPSIRQETPLNDISRCQNRECDNPAGYPKKPNSIYCSSRCQSRGTLRCIITDDPQMLISFCFVEQNLRQGRVKNVRKQPTPSSPIQKPTPTRLRARSTASRDVRSASPPSPMPSLALPPIHSFRQSTESRDESGEEKESSAKLRIDFLLS